MSSATADLQYGFRQLRLNPGFASLAIVTLALGIGLNTALFSVVRSVILKPLPYREPDRLARIWMDNRRLEMREDWASYANYQDYKRLGTSFESMAAFTQPTVNLIGDGDPERIDGAFAEAALFDVLGVSPAAGSLFTRDHETAGKENVVLIGWGLWQRRFAGGEAIGRTLDFDGRRMTIIGVMPAGFAFPSKSTEFWAPLAVPEAAKARRVGYFLQMVGRLKPGVTPAAAQSQMTLVGQQLEQQYPADNAGYGIYVNPLERHVAGNVRTPLFVLLGAVGFVLLIACVNVAGLFLARAERRSREIVVRSALGASRGRLVRQMLIESATVAIVAGAAGILAAYAGIRILVSLAPRDLPRVDEIALDATVFAFALAITSLTAIVCGLWPALRSSSVNLQEALRDSSRSVAGSKAAARTRASLLVAQCALAVVLLAGAGLLIRSLQVLHATDPGFQTASILTMRVNASRASFPQPPQLRQFYDQLLERVRRLPGVKGAAITSNLFLTDTPSSGTFTLEDRPPFPPSEQIEATTDMVSPDFFEMMQVPLVRGRFFDSRDRDGGARAIVINETFAKRYWPNEDPVGKRLVFGSPGERNPWITIVGVAADMHRRGLHRGARLETFFSTTQNMGRNMQLLVSTDGNALAVAPAVRAEVRALDRSAPVTAVSTVEAQLGESLAIRRFQAWLLAMFSLLAVLLTAVGVFGLMAQLVVRRTAEIGVRMALGASPADVLAMVLRQGAILAAGGALLGLLGAFLLARALQSLLFGVGPGDPFSYVSAAVVMGLSLLIACAVPAWRASRVDPTLALRQDG
ncbi:MAG: ABC transporter permease [Vicinamibacterales bacterium]